VIYLQYIYQNSGWARPASIALEIHDMDTIRTEILDEFAAAFPDCKVSLAPASADWLILVYRRVADDLYTRVKWGRKSKSRASLGVGFFCVDDRELEVVPGGSYLAWTCRELSIALLGANVVGRSLFRLMDRLLWLRESF
jgi:hypothetical protein